MVKGIIPRVFGLLFLRLMSMSLMSMSLMAVLLTGSAGAQQRQLVVPNELQLVVMIQTTLIAFNQANATGNYTVLRDLASPNFQQANTPARLGEIFSAERAQKTDISPIVLMRPKLGRPAAIDGNGRLHVQGFFPSRPKQVHFMLVFEAVGREWRLYALSVHSAEPTANQIVRDHWLTSSTYGTAVRR